MFKLKINNFIFILVIFLFSCKKNVFKGINNGNSESKFVKMFGKLKLKEPNNQLTKANFQLRIEKNKIIWLSITAIFNIEVYRILITKSRIKILNKTEKTFKAYSFREIKNKFGLNLSFKNIQKILLYQQNKDKYKNGLELNDKVSDEIILQNNNNTNKITVKYDFKTKIPYSDCTIKIFVNGLDEEIFRISLKNKKTFFVKEKITFPFIIPNGYEKIG